MKSATIESIATPSVSESARQARLSRDDRATPRRTRWGALYAILLMGVALCVAGSRIVSGVGHPALFQSGVVCAIIGLLVAWVRSNRASLSADKPGTRSTSEHLFSVIRIAFSPNKMGSGHPVFTEPPDTAPGAAAIRLAARASQR